MVWFCSWGAVIGDVNSKRASKGFGKFGHLVFIVFLAQGKSKGSFWGFGTDVVDREYAF